MTWRRVRTIYLVFGLLLLYVSAVEMRPERTEPAASRPDAPERSLLGIDAEAVGRLRLRRGDAIVVVAHDDDRWSVVVPADAAIPPDLVAALVGTLTAGQVSEVMTRDGDLGAFGLAEPSAEIEVGLRDARAPIRVLLGAPSPTKTALYAKRDDDAAVYLVGLNVRYYTDLIFEAARR